MTRVERIGDCELHLGDALEIAPTLGAGFADMIFVDPPYGHNNNNGDLIDRWEKALGRPHDGQSSRPIANDGAEANDLARWLFDSAPTWLRAGGCCCCCCCGGGGPDPQFARWSLMMDGPLDFKQMIVWDKGPMGMGWHYRRSYETVLVGQKRGAACKWYDTTDAVENIIRPGKIKKIIPQAEDHPTPKTWRLAAHFIQLHTLPGETVFDPFAGAMSTAIACVATGRKFIGIEIDERWFELGLKRLRDSAHTLPLPEPKPKQTVLI
jgi:DNA modification methylase